MQLAELTWIDVDRLPRTTPVVIPVAALEQHGHHLPLMTDSLLLGEVVRRVAVPLADRVLFTPLLWLGNSAHHRDFPGSLTASPRVYLDLLTDLADNFIADGFQRILFLNGHGGNKVPGRQVIFELRQKYRQRSDLLLLFATYWDFGKPSESHSDLVQSAMGHACEWETSMIQRLAPQLVRDVGSLATVPVHFGVEPAFRGWTSRDRTVPGHMGSPQHASPEKGEVLFQSFADGVQRFLERLCAWDGQSWTLA